jgi:hypothetical protein
VVRHHSLFSCCFVAIMLEAAAPCVAGAVNETLPSPGNDYEVACGAGGLTVQPISPAVTTQGGQAGTIDCPLPNGQQPARVRFSANQAFPYGRSIMWNILPALSARRQAVHFSPLSRQSQSSAIPC